MKANSTKNQTFKLIFLCLFFIFHVTFLAFSQNRKIAISPKPSWINKVVALDEKPSEKDIVSGYYIKLAETQENLELKTFYYHEIYQITSETGVQNASEISVSYSPAYQKLVFHQIQIKRNGKIINKLDISKFKIVQNETDLSRFIYNESFTAVLILEDVQKGDEIEFAYSLVGANSIFDGKYYGTFYFYSYTSVTHFYRSLLVPSNRKLYFKSFNNPTTVKESEKDGYKQYEWETNHIKPYESEDYTPSWLTSIPYVQVSEAESWEEVAKWATKINQLPSSISSGLQKKINEFKDKAKGDKEKYLELATRFVQDEIRYMGIEVGEHSHKPHAPEKVFKQRFGDCKDKALLLCTLLNANDIPAYLALVDTYKKGKVDELLPSPLAFNHAIVRTELDKKTLWIDATASLQRGSIGSIFIPYYGKALVAKNDEKKLQSITERYAGKTIVKETFTIGDIGEDVTLEVESSYYDNAAEETRASFASLSLNQMEKDYLDFYSNIYKELQVTVADSLRYEDNEEINIIKTYEKYTLKEFWKKSENTNKYTANVYFRILSNRLRVLPDKTRKSPIRLNYPLHLEYSVSMVMPENWELQSEREELNRKSYHFIGALTYNSDNHSINRYFYYKTLNDHVTVEDAPQYIKDMNHINESSAYELSWYKGAVQSEYGSNDDKDATTDALKGDIDWGIVFFGLMMVGITAFLCTRLYTYSLPENYFKVKNVKQIGDWLVLVGLGIGFTPIYIGYFLYSESYFNKPLWETVALLDPPQDTYYRITLYFELAANLIVGTYSIFLAVLFLKRRNTLPMFIQIFYGTNFVLDLIDYLLGQLLEADSATSNEGLKEMLGSLVAAAVWIPYFFKSDTVKNTFVFGYKKSNKQNESEEKDESPLR